MNRSHGAALAVALTFAVACSQEKQTVDTTTSQTPSQPTGSIVGIVTSLRTGAPLQGVTVSAPAGGGIVSDTTDSNGAYALGGLVAGATYTVRFATTGYVPRFEYAAVPDTAGDYPSNGIVQVDMPLAQSNATLSGHVYARDGAPAVGVVLTADLRARGFDLVATATTDAQGAYALTGLPGAPAGLLLDVVAQPWDANADGLADYDALSRTGTTYPAAVSLLDFDLRLAAAELLLLTSNLESGLLPASASIQLTFNRALEAAFIDFTHITLYDLTADPLGTVKVAVTASLDTTGKILTIVPAAGTALAAYHSYRLVVNAVATNGDTFVVSRTFTADVPASLLPAVTGLAVTSPADFDTASFTLSWNASANASGYQVWVRDTNRNPSYLLVRTLLSTPAPSTSVTLPATFDWYSGDAIQTPFAFGVGVDFVVVAVNAAGDAALPSTVVPVHRQDTVHPVVEQAVQIGNADNSASGTPRTITLTLTFSEYIDPAFAPTIGLPDGSMTATFAWQDPNRTVGRFSITIPPSIDGRGTYTVSGAKDLSGNAMTLHTGTITSTVQLVTNGGFEAGSLSGWTTSATSTISAPAATQAAVATGAWSAQVGNAIGTYNYGTSTMYQNVTLPTGYASIALSLAYRPYSGSSTYDYNACYLKDSTGATTYVTLFSTYSTSSSFTTVTRDVTAYAGMTVRITCLTSSIGYQSGMYLDDVSILATP